MVVVLLVAIVVVGPRQLPSMMRTAGQWVSRLRRMSTDLRAQSGIDQLMRDEGIDRSLHEIRALSNVNVLEGLENLTKPAAATSAKAAASSAVAVGATAIGSPYVGDGEDEEGPVEIPREKEYPVVGCDAYDAEPDDASSNEEDVGSASGSSEMEPQYPTGAVATSDPTKRGGGAAST